MNNLTNINTAKLPSSLRRVLFLFVLTISIGYSFSLRQLYITTGASPTNLQEHYLGNEENEDAEVLKFKKNEKELLTFLHNHLLSLGVLLLLLTLILYFTPLNALLKKILLVEPFISLIVTFSSIYGLWSGIDFLKYLIPLSGFLFHLSFGSILIILLIKLGYKKSEPK